MTYAGYVLEMLACLTLGATGGGWASRRAGPPPLVALLVMTTVGLGMLGLGLAYMAAVP